MLPTWPTIVLLITVKRCYADIDFSNATVVYSQVQNNTICWVQREKYFQHPRHTAGDMQPELHPRMNHLYLFQLPMPGRAFPWKWYSSLPSSVFIAAGPFWCEYPSAHIRVGSYVDSGMGWMQDIRIVQSVPANNWLWMNLAKVVAVINHLGDCVAVDPSLFTKCHHLFLPALKLFVFHMPRCSSERVQCRKVTDQRSLHSSGLHCDISSVCQKSVFAEIEIRSHIGTGRQRTERSSLLLWISESNTNCTHDISSEA